MYIIGLLFIAGLLLQGIKVLANLLIVKADNYYEKSAELQPAKLIVEQPPAQPADKEVFMSAPLHQSA